MYICIYIYIKNTRTHTFFWLCHTTYGILATLLEIKPGAPAVRMQSPNHWITREILFHVLSHYGLL